MDFDVYGAMRVRVIPGDDGWHRVYAVRPLGKLHLLDDVVVPDEATADEIVEILEAVFHEMGRAGGRISRLP